MVRKTVGYVELEWTCKRCGTRNPGSRKICSSCGAAMEEGDRFETPPQQELITDEEELAKAKRGPDVHCPYCGARNPAGSEKCTQCGANLTDAKAREKGRVVGAFKDKPVPDVSCPFCGTPNPANAAKCKKCGGNLTKEPADAARAPRPSPRKGGFLIWLAGLAALACLITVGAFFFLGSRTSDTTATVQSVRWERTIPIVQQAPVEYESWEDEIPAGAQKGSCEQKYHHTQPEPAPGAEEVCGTPYTVDLGNGYAEVVQDCEYRIYYPWCKYTVDEWKVVDTAVAQGGDLNPRWPALVLRPGQREGDDRSEVYTITFRVEDGGDTYKYTVSTADKFSKFGIGSRWRLKVNTFGNVTDVEPAE